MKALIALCLLTVSSPTMAACPSGAIDAGIHLTSAQDAIDCRTALIQAAFGQPTLPTSLPTITTIPNPFASVPAASGWQIARVDQYSQTGTTWNGVVASNLYVSSAAQSNNRLVTINGGHDGNPGAPGTCDSTPPALTGQFGLTVPDATKGPPITEGLLPALLRLGYDVFFMNMLGCGEPGYHCGVSNPITMSYHFLALLQAMNYWQAHNSYRDYNFVGLSGGGWTAITYSALDPRIHISISVAGNTPGMFWGPNGPGDTDCSGYNGEQTLTAYYSIAGYLDQYLLASFGPGRIFQQVLNRHDDCCYNEGWMAGFPSTPATNFNTLYSGTSNCNGGSPCTWDTYLAAYSAQLASANATIAPSHNLATVIDETAQTHQISEWARTNVILPLLVNNQPPIWGGGVPRRR